MERKDFQFESYLSRINQFNPSLKAFIALKDPETLRRDWHELQTQGVGNDLPLRGVLVAVKDMIDVRGFPTTGGTIYKRWPQEDAAVIKKIKAAGAIIPGKTNMHELAHGITGENPHYGPVPNPLNQNHMAGGSSSGSAAAVAAGLVPIALGSDTAGSVRIPASFCGIYGFKPSRRCISMQGCMPLSQSLDHLGFFGHSLKDICSLFQVLAPGSNPEPEKLSGKRIGVPYSFFLPLIEQQTENQLAEFLQSLNGIVQSVEIPILQGVFQAASAIVFKEAYVNYGSYLQKPESLGRDVKACLEIGRGVSRSEYAKGRKFQEVFSEEMTKVFSTYDLLIIPSVPAPAPVLQSRRITIRGVEYNLASALTGLNYPASLAGLPALSVPWQSKGELPVGFQLIARDDTMLLDYAMSQPFLSSSEPAL